METIVVTDSLSSLVHSVGRAAEVCACFDSALAGRAGVAAVTADEALRGLTTALAASATLRSITVDNFPEAFVVAVASALPGCSSVRSFAVRSFTVALSDAAGAALMEALVNTTTLESFTLQSSGSKFGAATAAAVDRSFRLAPGEAAPALRHLKLQVCNAAKVDDQLGVALAEAVGRCRGLRSATLDVSRTRIGDATGLAVAAAVSGHAELRSVGFSAARTRVTGRSGEAIGLALRSSPSLREFTLGFGDTAIGLETHAAIGAALEENSKLEGASLQVQGLQFGRREGSVLAKAIRLSKGLRSLELRADRAFGFDDSTLAALGAGVAKAATKPLERLVLRAQGAAFGDAGAAAFAAGIRECGALRELEFDAEGTAVRDGCGAALVEAAARCPELRRLQISVAGTDIGNDFCSAMANGFRDNARLEAFAFDATNTKVGDEGGQAMARLIESAFELRSFAANLSCSKVGSETAIALAGALEGHNHVESFTLRASRTALADDGVAALFAAAASGRRRGVAPALRAFTLDGAQTKISDATANAVSLAIMRSASLRELIFQASPSVFSCESLDSIVEAVRRNVSLKSLHLFEGDARCAQYIARNREARRTCTALSSIAKRELAPDLSGMKNQFLQNLLLQYFLPEDHSVLPPEFAHINAAAFKS